MIPVCFAIWIWVDRSWWRNDMITFSILLALCEWNPPVTDRFTLKGPVARNFNVTLIYAWTDGWTNTGVAGDLSRHDAYCDVSVMGCLIRSASILCPSRLWRRIKFILIYALILLVIVYSNFVFVSWRHFSRHWPFLRGIHRSPADPPIKDQWRRALMFPLMYAWTCGWTNTGIPGDLRSHDAYCDVIVIVCLIRCFRIVCQSRLWRRIIFFNLRSHSPGHNVLQFWFFF